MFPKRCARQREGETEGRHVTGSDTRTRPSQQLHTSNKTLLAGVSVWVMEETSGKLA